MIYVIMCTYNGEKYIKEQVQSILDNTVNSWKIFIMDDQSADDTIKIAKEFQRKCPEKIFINCNQNQRGAIVNFLSHTYEIGLQMTNDDFIMLCDQDDIWNPDKIQKTMNGMNELINKFGNDIPLLACTDATVVDDAMNIINQSFHKMNNYNIHKLDFSHLMMENKVQGCTILLNRSMALMLDRLPRKATMHDGWLALIASAFGKIKYIDEPTMKYRQHGDNIQGSMEYIKDVKSKFLNLGSQRKIVMSTTGQIEEFLAIYGDMLSNKVQKEAVAFATLPQQNFFARRYSIIKYHMWKSGILRNIGLMLLI